MSVCDIYIYICMVYTWSVVLTLLTKKQKCKQQWTVTSEENADEEENRKITVHWIRETKKSTSYSPVSAQRTYIDLYHTPYTCIKTRSRRYHYLFFVCFIQITHSGIRQRRQRRQRKKKQNVQMSGITSTSRTHVATLVFREVFTSWFLWFKFSYFRKEHKYWLLVHTTAVIFLLLKNL